MDETCENHVKMCANQWQSWDYGKTFETSGIRTSLIISHEEDLRCPKEPREGCDCFEEPNYWKAENVCGNQTEQKK